MKNFKLAAAIALGASAASAQNGAYWTFDYISADRAGQLSACAAEISFSNAYFVARLHGEEFDFVYYRDDFTLPFDRRLGSVIFRIDGRAFVLGAESLAQLPTSTARFSRSMFLTPVSTERGAIFDALRNGRIFDMEFPDGSSYRFPLTGSARALNFASECWSTRPTGPFSNNPFTQPTVNNPFE